MYPVTTTQTQTTAMWYCNSLLGRNKRYYYPIRCRRIPTLVLHQLTGTLYSPESLNTSVGGSRSVGGKDSTLEDSFAPVASWRKRPLRQEAEPLPSERYVDSVPIPL